MAKELFNQTLKSIIGNTDRISVGVPGQTGCDNVYFSDFKDNVRPNDPDTFENSDLDGSFELTITHSRNTSYVKATLYDGSNIEQLTAGIFSIVDADNVKFSMGGAITGTWTYILEYF